MTSKKESSNFFYRIRIISWIFVFIPVVFVVRLFQIQVLNNSEYKEKAENQYVAPLKNGIFERGSIFFSKKDGTLISAGTTMSGFTIAITPKMIEDKDFLYSEISKIISMDKNIFMEKAQKIDDPYEEIATRVSKEDADKLVALDDSISIFQEKWRFYPGGNLSSKVIGFVAYKDDELSGRYGLEYEYDSILSQSGEDVRINIFAEIFSNISETIFKSDNKQGDIVTNIEPFVSQMVEGEIKNILSKWSASSVGAIVINPTDGSIYSMGHVPDFDLNNFRDVKNTSTFANPLVENIFELGSVIKPLVVAASFDTGVFDEKKTYNDTGSVFIEGKEIKNFDGKGRGIVDAQDILGDSLNTGMVHIAGLLGKEDFRKYMISFGLTEKTGIDLPNEAKGLTSNLNSPRMLEYANMSFGQGIAISPINAVRAFSVLANGGNLVTPHFLKKIEYEDGRNTEYDQKKESIRVLKEGTSDRVTRILVENIDTYYFSGKKSMEHYSIAGKTGTAQIAKEDGSGYYEGKNAHSFFGYFPAYDPQFLVFLYAMEPKGARFASETLIDPFMNIAKFLINYYDIPPDR